MLANYISLENAGITAFIPPHERTNGINGFWGRDHFRYVPEQDIYLCPSGKIMKPVGMCEGKKRVVYRCEPGTCQTCHLKEKCTPHVNSRSVTRLVDQRLIEEAKKRIENPQCKELMRQRKTRIEGVFALGKELHGLRRTRLMGRWKVQIQLWLIASVINLKRAIKALTNLLNGAHFSNQSETFVGCQIEFCMDALTGSSPWMHFVFTFTSQPVTAAPETDKLLVLAWRLVQSS
jgi:hypothetical protein